MRPDVVIEYRRAHPPRVLAALKPRSDDDPPPRPGGVPMRLRSGWAQPDPREVIARKERIRSWRAAI